MKHLSPVLAWSPLIQEAPWNLAYLFFSFAHENGVRLSLTGSLRGLRKRVRVCTHMPGMVPSISRKNTWSREVPEVPQRESENRPYPAEHLRCHGRLVPVRFQCLGSRDGCSVGAQTYEPSAFLGADRIFPFSALLTTWYFVGMCLFSLAMFWENCLHTWSGTLRRLFPSPCGDISSTHLVVQACDSLFTQTGILRELAVCSLCTVTEFQLSLRADTQSQGTLGCH